MMSLECVRERATVHIDESYLSIVESESYESLAIIGQDRGDMMIVDFVIQRVLVSNLFFGE